MSEPSTKPPIIGSDEESSPNRNFYGWICLAILLALMCAVNLAGSLRGTKGTKAPDDETDTLLKLEVSARRIVPSSIGGEELDMLKDSLSTRISDLVEGSHSDPAAAFEYAELRTEQGHPVSPESIATLQKSSVPTDHILAQIYGGAKLTRAQAETLAAGLPDEPFPFRLAKVHAFEKAGDTDVRNRAFTGNFYIAFVFGRFGGFALLFSSGLAWIFFMRARNQKRLVPLGVPMKPERLMDADRMAVRAFQILALFLLLSFFVPFLLGAKGERLLWAEGAVGLLVVVSLPMLARIPVGGKRLPLEAVGLSTKDFFRHALIGIGGFLLEFPVAMAMLSLGLSIFHFLPPPSHPVDKQLEDAKNLGQLLPILFFGTITAPIWEEFVFRGLLFPAVGRLFGRLLPSAFVTSLVFAMIHPQGIGAWLGLATVGFFGCMLTYYTRSIVPTIVMHMTHNTLTFIAALLALAKV